MSHDRHAWEYQALESGAAVPIAELNRLGAEGWELVTIVDGQAVLKRPAADLRAIVTTDQRTHVYAAHGKGGHA
jgi:hypothetical protein